MKSNYDSQSNTLVTKNYNDLDFYNNENLGNNDTIFTFNSSISSVQRLTWDFLKKNIINQIINTCKIEINNNEYFFNDNQKLDLTIEFDQYLKKDGSVLLDIDYIPSQDQHIATKKYVDEKENNNSVDLSDYLKKDGSVLLNDDYYPKENNSIVSKGYIVNNFLTKDGNTLLPDDYIPRNSQQVVNRKFLTYYIRTDGTSLMDDSYIPTKNKQIATKEYVDSKEGGSNVDLSNYLKNDGSILLQTGYFPKDYYSVSTRGYVDNQLTNYLKNDGSIPLANYYIPKQDKDIATKEYVDSKLTSSKEAEKENITTNNYITRDGTTTMIDSYNPCENKHLVTKEYIDSQLDILSATPFYIRVKSEKSLNSKNNLSIPLTYKTINIFENLPNSFKEVYWDTNDFSKICLIKNGKIWPLNYPTTLNIQLSLWGEYTFLDKGAPLSFLGIRAVTKNSDKPFMNACYLGASGKKGYFSSYYNIPYEIDVNGGAYTNGITIQARITNTKDDGRINGISWVISQLAFNI